MTPADRRRRIERAVADRFQLAPAIAAGIVRAVLLQLAREGVAAARALDRSDPDLACGARVVAVRLMLLTGAAADRAERRTRERLRLRRHTGNEPE